VTPIETARLVRARSFSSRIRPGPVALAIVLAALAAAENFGRYLSDRHWIVEDAQQHIAWTYRLRDPSLFPGDVVMDFFAAMAPIGYRGLFALAAPMVDPLLFSKCLPIVLFGLTLIFMWKLGSALEPRCGGAVAVVLALELASSFKGGFPRSFALALLVPHLYFLVTRRYAAAAVTLPLEAGFYPQLLFVGAGTHAATLLRDLAAAPSGPSWLDRLRGARRPLALLLGGLVLSGLFLGAAYGRRPANLGPILTAAEARQLPEFQRGGRSYFFDPAPVRFWIHNQRAGVGWSSRLRTLAVATLVFVLVLGRRVGRTPRILVDTVCVSVVLFGLAHLTLFRMHLPNRYLSYTVPLVLTLFLAVHARAVVEAVAARWSWIDRVRAGLARRPAVGALLLIVIVLGSAVRMTVQKPNRVDPAWVEISAFLAELPKDVLIAGEGPALSGVPLFAQRSIYEHPELSLPYFQTFREEMLRRRAVVHAALDAPGPGALAAFCRASGVTHLLIDRAHPLPRVVSWLADRAVFQNRRFLVAPCPTQP